MTHAGGIVLCGGRSSRMGRPKAWLPFGDELMIQRVVRVLREAVEPVVVVAAPGQDVPQLPPGVDVVRDEVEGRGPLQGLAAGLAALRGRAEVAYLSACDAPFLTAAFVRRVVELLASCAPSGARSGETRILTDSGSPLVAVPRVGGYFHPLAATYRLSATDTVLSLLAADRLRPAFLFDAVPTRVIGPHELPDLDSLRNLNTPEDYESALRELRPTIPL